MLYLNKQIQDQDALYIGDSVFYSQKFRLIFGLEPSTRVAEMCCQLANIRDHRGRSYVKTWMGLVYL